MVQMCLKCKRFWFYIIFDHGFYCFQSKTNDHLANFFFFFNILRKPVPYTLLVMVMTIVYGGQVNVKLYLKIP